MRPTALLLLLHTFVVASGALAEVALPYTQRSDHMQFPGDVLLRRWREASLVLPNSSSGEVNFHRMQRKLAAATKARYAHILRVFAHIDLGKSNIDNVLGSFSFIEPLAILSVIAAHEGRMLELGRLCVVDIGGGAQIPEFLEPFLGFSRYLAFDAQKGSVDGVSALTAKYPRFEIIQAIATPPSLPTLFAKHSVPSKIAVLKIDIDSCDCDILQAALTVTSPSIIVIEVNPSFPPPIRFNLGWAPNMFHNNGGARSPVFGCSLAFATELVRRSGYALLQAPIEDAYFVRSSALHLFGDVPHEPSAVYAMGNPFLYSYRNFGPGVLREWQGWVARRPSDASELEALLSVVRSNVTKTLKDRGMMAAELQVQLS